MQPILRNLVAFCVAATAVCVPAVAQKAERSVPPEADVAPIAFLFDLTSGQVLFEREADRRFMPASITKVMTTFLAFEWMEEGKIVPAQSFTIKPEVWRAWNNVGSTMFLPHDARVTVDDLVHGVTTVSANDGAAALADGAAGSIEEWVAAMNSKASEIGMADSHFGTPNGWMDDGRTFVTARDLTTLATAMIRRHPTKYRHFIGQPAFTYNNITQPNHDPISGVVPGADGIKTGFTNQAGYGFLGSAERNGRRLVMVVAASPRARDRDRAARNLIEWGFGAFEQYRLFAPEAPVGVAEVQDGSAREVALVSPYGIYVDLPEGVVSAPRLAVQYEGPLRAPIRKGERVAMLTISAPGMQDHRIPLVARDAVAEAGLAGRILNGVLGWIS
ncbi:D-alanyl-D-alanine carboxypeptidase family protein [Erythrobacter sp. SD-21]|uniref:D-alanyl-D-alanine carboxypeptidase family protein n=1 Tax=Erythrobacter sp. SD-21 TaxID=161528 RepID=UPI000153FA2B|nr:D-alanyl-D-alanine carboxypeptidase family protein [Erythrobacter sp. SD-21]EDL50307.1 Serine-type D-Ala-D-Ala carboxypeptidase [Erythrobacter sp. SD-21]